MKKSTINDCTLIELSKINNWKGNLTSIENNSYIPFNLKRVFYLYDIPGGVDRGAHAHKKCHQLLIAVSGSFDVFLFDGKNKKIVSLNRPYVGLHIPPGIWAAEKSFSSGSTCLVLTSENYNEKDYIRKYENFLKYKKNEYTSLI